MKLKKIYLGLVFLACLVPAACAPSTQEVAQAVESQTKKQAEFKAYTGPQWQYAQADPKDFAEIGQWGWEMVGPVGDSRYSCWFKRKIR